MSVFGLDSTKLAALGTNPTWNSMTSFALNSSMTNVLNTSGANFVSNVGTGNEIIGHMTVSPTDPVGTVKMVNVTSYVTGAAAAMNTFVGFMIVRRMRSDGCLILNHSNNLTKGLILILTVARALSPILTPI
jgi:hypothetical protein